MRVRLLAVFVISVLGLGSALGCASAPPAPAQPKVSVRPALVTMRVRDSLSDSAMDSAWCEIMDIDGVADVRILSLGQAAGHSRLEVTVKDGRRAQSVIDAMLKAPYVVEIAAHPSRPASDVISVKALP